MFDIRRCTFKKAVNYAAMRLSRGRGRKARGMPTRLIIEPSSICNLKCAICPHGTGKLRRDKVTMPFALFKKIIDETGDRLFEITFAGMGEPLLNTDLSRMVAYAHGRSIYTQLFTNLLALDEKGAGSLVLSRLDRIIISLDSATKETYFKMKSFDGFERLMRSWSALRGAMAGHNSRLPSVSVSFVATKFNKEEIPAAEMIAHDMGCDEFFVKSVNLCNAGAAPESFTRSDIPVNGHNRYSGNKRGKRSRQVCPWIWNSGMIYANGDVGPCCFDTAADNVFGNCARTDFRDIWNGGAFMNFRARAISDLNGIAICRACTVKNGRSKT